jgi:hypothetical protein
LKVEISIVTLKLCKGQRDGREVEQELRGREVEQELRARIEKMTSDEEIWVAEIDIIKNIPSICAH